MIKLMVDVIIIMISIVKSTENIDAYAKYDYDCSQNYNYNE